MCVCACVLCALNPGVSVSVDRKRRKYENRSTECDRRPLIALWKSGYLCQTEHKRYANNILYMLHLQYHLTHFNRVNDMRSSARDKMKHGRRPDTGNVNQSVRKSKSKRRSKRESRYRPVLFKWNSRRPNCFWLRKFHRKHFPYSATFPFIFIFYLDPSFVAVKELLHFKRFVSIRWALVLLYAGILVRHVLMCLAWHHYICLFVCTLRILRSVEWFIDCVCKPNELKIPVQRVPSI